MNAPLTKAEAIAACDVPGLRCALRAALLANVDSIPGELKAIKGWLVWKATTIDPTRGKFNKIPIYPSSRQNRHGEQGSAADMANLGTWDEAMAALNDDKSLAGVGFALLPDFGVLALDVDHCVTDGKLRPDVDLLVDDTYAEFSPSGTGIRAFWLGEARDGKNHDTGYELFHSKGFVTITGNWIVGGPLPVLSDDMRVKLETLSRATGKSDKKGKTERLNEAAANDPRLKAIIAAGLYERDMGDGKHSICCPFEHRHSDAGRAAGDGDTTYFQPHYNGYTEGYIFCHHTHGNDQSKYWAKIGCDPLGEAVQKILAAYESPTGDGWPDPHPIPDDLPPVPTFDLALLPDALRPWISDIAERMQISPDIPAIGAVTALSAAIGRRVQIRPKAHDDWTVVPNLWGGVVAPPGYMKSPALSEVMKPLHRLESEAHREHVSELTEWAAAKERIKLRNRAHEQLTVSKIKKKDTDLPELLPEPEEPVATRYTVNNFSLEALGEVLLGNPNGVLAFSDEIHGLLLMAQKPGNEGLNDFLLSAWNGDGAFTFDRIGRGLNRRIPHVCVAVLGGIQPGRLVEHIRGATHGGAGDSGLVQRFQLLTWPDLREEWTLVDRQPDQAAQEGVYRVFERVVGRGLQDPMDGLGADDDPSIRRFDGEAQAAFYVWLEGLERELRGDAIPSVMASHLSKYRSLVPSLALIFAVADNVKGAVPLRHLRQAISWAEYLRPHAERAYSCTTRPDTRHARALIAKIRDGSVSDGFKPSDVYLKGWSLLDRDGLTKATDLLCDLVYLVRVETRPDGAGRPSITFKINPKGEG
jgi:hypothetical protein